MTQSKADSNGTVIPKEWKRLDQLKQRIRVVRKSKSEAKN